MILRLPAQKDESPLWNEEVMMMKGRTMMRRAALACLLLLLMCVFAYNSSQFPVAAQGRPDLVWMRGGNLVANTKEVVVYSPDGKWLASGDERLTKLWRTSDGALIRTLNVGWSTNALVFSPDSRHLYTAGTGVRFISMPDGKVEQTIAGSANTVDISPDGQTLAVADGQGTVRIFDPKTGALRTSFAAHTANIATVAFSPSGKLLATGSADKSIKLWNVGSWSLQTTWTGHTNEVLSLSFSPDGTRMVSCDTDYTNLWNSAGQLLTSKNISGTHAVRFSPDGQTFGIAWSVYTQFGNFSSIRIYATATATRLQDLPAYSQTLAFSPTGGKVTSAEFQTGNSIIEWDIAAGKLAKYYGTHYATPVRRVAVSPDNQAVTYLTSYNNGGGDAVDILSPTTGSLIRQLAYRGYPQGLFDFQYSGNGQTIFLGTSLLYGYQSSFLTSYGVEAYRSSDGADLRSLGGINGPQSNFAISPRDPIYVTVNGYVGGVYEVHSSSDGSLIRTLPRPGWFGTAQLLFSPDGQFFAELSAGIQLFRVSDWSDINLLGAQANAGAFSPDSRLLVTGDSTGTLKWWDTRTGALLHTMQAHTKPIGSVAFSPDGGTLATGGQDGTLAIWNTDTAELLARYNEEVTIFGDGRSDFVTVSYSPDGKFLYYGRADGTLACALNPYRNAIFPNHGGNTDKTTIRIVPPDNFPLVNGATVKLTADGQQDIIPLGTTVESDFVMSATFDLRGAPLGKRNVVITLPGGETRTYPQGFTIEQGTTPQVTTEVIGRVTLRGGAASTYNVLVHNNANVDSGPLVGWLSFPKYMNWKLGNAQQAVTIATTDKNMILVFELSSVPASSTSSIGIILTAPDDPMYAHAQFELHAGATLR